MSPQLNLLLANNLTEISWCSFDVGVIRKLAVWGCCGKRCAPFNLAYHRVFYCDLRRFFESCGNRPEWLTNTCKQNISRCGFISKPGDFDNFHISTPNIFCHQIIFCSSAGFIALSLSSQLTVLDVQCPRCRLPIHSRRVPREAGHPAIADDPSRPTKQIKRSIRNCATGELCPCSMHESDRFTNFKCSIKTAHLAITARARIFSPQPSDAIRKIFYFVALSPNESWEITNMFWSIRNMQEQVKSCVALISSLRSSLTCICVKELYPFKLLISSIPSSKSELLPSKSWGLLSDSSSAKKISDENN